MMAADDQSLVHQRRIAAFEQTAYVVSGSGMGKKVPEVESDAGIGKRTRLWLDAGIDRLLQFDEPALAISSAATASEIIARESAARHQRAPARANDLCG